MKKLLYLSLMILAGALIISCSEKKKEEPEPLKMEAPEPAGPEILDLAGAISKYKVVMHIEIDGKDVGGQYYYMSSGPDHPLILSGTADESGNLDIHETNEEGQPTGHFMGQWDGQEFLGEFVNYRGQHFPFKLVKNEEGADIPAVAIGAVSGSSSSILDMDDEETSSYGESSSGSEDWDAVLRSYEQYVDKYISYIKKAANGDMNALAEYPALMAKAQEYSDKLEKAQGEMSASQWARYTRITNKMLAAAQEMQ